MDYSALRLFLSEENIKLHLEYLNKQKLRYSILKKCSSDLLVDDIKHIYRQHIPTDLKNEALRLLCDIKSHELFFQSFVSQTHICKSIKKYFGSQDRLLYELLTIGQKEENGFVYLCIDKSGAPKILFRNNEWEIFVKYEPILAFDLCEHVYFKDYGFNKEKYLRNSLVYLNLKLLDEKLLSIDN